MLEDDRQSLMAIDRAMIEYEASSVFIDRCFSIKNFVVSLLKQLWVQCCW